MEELQFEILVPNKVGRNENHLTVNVNTKHVTIGNAILERIGVTQDNKYVRFARVGHDFYISDKRTGTFGYSLKKASASTMRVGNGGSLIETGLTHRMYTIGEAITQGSDIWYKLCEIVK